MFLSGVLQQIFSKIIVSEDDKYMVPEHPRPTILEHPSRKKSAQNYSICLGFWANLMQIKNMTEWKKYQEEGDTTFTEREEPLCECFLSDQQIHPGGNEVVSISFSDLSQRVKRRKSCCRI